MEPGGFSYRTRAFHFHEGEVGLDLELLESFEQESARLYAHLARSGRPAEVRLSPMFGVIWPSARVATRWMVDCRPGERVLELGCGLGLPSLVAASRGAQVLATDNHPHAGAFLQANAARNGVGVEFLEVGAEDVEAGEWDRVVAADVLFAWDMPRKMAAAFARTLAPGGRGLLVDPGRPWLDAFLAEATAHGLEVVLSVEEAAGDELFAVSLALAR